MLELDSDLCLSEGTTLTNLSIRANSSLKLLLCKSLQGSNLVLVKVKPAFDQQQLCCLECHHEKHQITFLKPGNFAMQ